MTANLKNLLRTANGPFLWAAVMIGIAFWVVGALIEATLLDEGGIVDTILVPDVKFAFLRTTVLAILVAFGGLAQKAINRRKIAERALREEMVFRDQLTEEQELTARMQAEEKARLGFLNTISHELRTPLTVLLTFSRLVRRNREGNLSNRQADQLDLVVSNGQRLAQMIDDLVNLSNLSSPDFKVMKSELSVPELVHEQADSLRPILKDRSQQLVVTVDPKARSAYGDWVRLGQVISNLVGNASKFSPTGSVIQLSVHPIEDCLQFTVANPGDPIPEDERKRVFDMFYRASNEATRATSGTGIGLSVCKAIVEKHDGKIWLEPWLDGHNRFTFKIPANAPDVTSEQVNDNRIRIATPS